MALKKLYFPHEFDASSNPKLIAVNRNFGMAGIGIYWVLIENLYQSNGELTNSEIEELAWNYHMESNEMINVANLVLKHETDKKTNVTVYYSNGVKKRIVEREEKSNAARKGAYAKWGKDKKSKAEQKPVPEWYNEYFKNLQEREKNKKTKELSKEECKKTFDSADRLFGEESKGEKDE